MAEVVLGRLGAGARRLVDYLAAFPRASEVRRAWNGLFQLPVESVISVGRVCLVSTALLALLISGASPGGKATAAYACLFTYTVFAAALAGFGWNRPLKFSAQIATHAVDVAMVSGLMYLTDGPISPYFLFFTFVLLTGTLRWNGRGALLTAGLIALIFFGVLVATSAEQLSQARGLERVIVRTGYLIVAGAMLAYFGTFRERGRTRLAQLVAWPGPESEADAEVGPSRAALAHAARLMGAPRVLLVWQEGEDPDYRYAYWAEGRVPAHGELPGSQQLISPEDYRGRIRLAGPRSGFGAQFVNLSRHLVRDFDISDCLTAPFALPVCRGRIFVIDPAGASDDDVLLSELTAVRIGVDLEHEIARRGFTSAAAAAERMRLARDLHDGVLQTMTAANLHLKMIAEDAPPPVGRRLEDIRLGLVEEQQRVRTFVEENRWALKAAATVDLAREVNSRFAKLEQEWGCGVNYRQSPRNIQVPRPAALHVRHLIAEAVSNAARHGGATMVTIDVAASPMEMRITIRDNGCGFPGLSGEYDAAALAQTGLAPRSLQARVVELGGELYLRTGADGSELTAWIPYG